MASFSQSSRSLSRLLIGAAVVSLFAVSSNAVAAGEKKAAKSQTQEKASDNADKGKKGKKDTSNAPGLVATEGDWRAFVTASGKGKTCYALSQPKDRTPASLKRDPAYIFISTRPAENVKNETSIMLGFDTKANSTGKAEIGNNSYVLSLTGKSAWLKNAAEESQFVDALKRGSKLVIKADSVKGKQSTDTYSLSGFGQILDHVAKECR